MGQTVHEALTRMEPGSRVVYRTGPNLKGCRHVKRVRELYDLGRVELVQQRAADYIERGGSGFFGGTRDAG